MIIFQVRIQSEKARQAHQKDQMKIGKTTATLVQPDNGMLQICKQRTVFGLFTQSTIQKLRQEQSNGRLIRIIGNRGKRIKRLCLFHLIYSGIRSEISFKLHQRQRLEQHRFHRSLARTGHRHQKRSPSGHLGIDVYDNGSILILQWMQYNSLRFL